MTVLIFLIAFLKAYGIFVGGSAFGWLCRSFLFGGPRV